MDSQNSNGDPVSAEAMQGRIQSARREAETLKDRIKRKKDELADTTRESTAHQSIFVVRVVDLARVLSLLLPAGFDPQLRSCSLSRFPMSKPERTRPACRLQTPC